MSLARLAVASGKPSGDGLYHLRYPDGNAIAQAMTVFDYSAGFLVANQAEFVHSQQAVSFFTGETMQIVRGLSGEHEATATWYGTKVNIQSFTTDFTFQIGFEAISGEAFGTGNGTVGPYTHTLAHGARPGTLVITAGSITGTDDGNGNITGAGISGAITDDDTVSVTFTSALANGTAITCAYDAPDFGMCFVVHNDPRGTSSSADANGIGFMAYAGQAPDPAILNSVAIAFNTSAGKQTSTSTVGCFVNGGPFMDAGIAPLQDLLPQGVDLFAGNVMSAHVAYDGAALSLRLTDTVTNAVAYFDWPIDIPTIVGASTAYIGFSGGTIPAGPETVPGWMWSQGINQRLTAPTFSPAPGSYTSAQTVTISAPVSGATVYYTTDGTPPTTKSTQYTGPISVSSTALIQAMATHVGYEDSLPAQGMYRIQSAGSPNINFPSGFASAAGLFWKAGGATISGSAMTVVDAAVGVGSAFYVTRVPVDAFTTNFMLELPASYSGLAFVIANQGLSPCVDTVKSLQATPAAGAVNATLSTALTAATASYDLIFSDGEARAAALTGNQLLSWTTPLSNAVSATVNIGRPGNTCVSGGPYSLGVGISSSNQSFGYQGIGNGVAVIFDSWTNSVGLSVGGGPVLENPVTGITLGAHPDACAITYDGTTLSLTVTDTITHATFSTAWAVDIVAHVGAITAYVGFTASEYYASPVKVDSWTM